MMNTTETPRTSVNSGAGPSSHASDARGSDHVVDEADSGGGAPEPTLSYLEQFRDWGVRERMPHWRNILFDGRNPDAGTVTGVYFTRTQATWMMQRWTALSREVQPLTITQPPAVNTAFGPFPPGPPAIVQALIVNDLSNLMMDCLGPNLNLSPEVFEEHLVRSGYTPASYDDPDTITWLTHLLPKKSVSIRWHSPLLRQDEQPRNMAERRMLVNKGIEWKEQAGTDTKGWPITEDCRLSTLSNIFRRDWPLFIPRGKSPKKPEKDSWQHIREKKEQEQKEKNGEYQVVAWEECATFSWGQLRDGQFIPILMLDPLPQLQLESPRPKVILPFTRRATPRSPPPSQLLSGNPTTVLPVWDYAFSVKSTHDDMMEELTRIVDAATIIHRDTTALLVHLSHILDQIRTGTLDERQMQDSLSHWRTLLSRAQSELPTLASSLHEFFLFPYHQSPVPLQPPPSLTASLSDLESRIRSLSARATQTHTSLLSEMSLLSSRRSISEAESVSRLTELAFLFIPMTFAASLFSMQIRELADAPPPLFAFIIAAVVAVVVSYLLRAVQASVGFAEMKRKMEERMRTEMGVVGSEVRVRTVVRWVYRSAIGSMRIMGCIVLVLVGLGVVLPLWRVGVAETGEGVMDGGFRGAITAVMLLLVVGIFVTVAWLYGGEVGNDGSADSGSVFGFGRMWREINMDDRGADGGRGSRSRSSDAEGQRRATSANSSV
ncbi:hypothetical protein B0T14DRAFT_152819 [Immersiella caudata]|uniref:Mg2+ transporter protein, CorA-like/Zinc transport protein ZntB n=1 Tax=Immersiella caudata TaxID=314043 RepID=A0AA40C2M2_9PEZI|nr:hypothetical protein B0T14DRAFT_152819 [Immersiella caudata]